jgi:hypothetical protein
VLDGDRFKFVRKDEYDHNENKKGKQEILRKGVDVLNLYEDENNKLIGIEAESTENGNKLIGKKGKSEEPAHQYDLSQGHEIINCDWDEDKIEYTNFRFKFAPKK